MRIENSFILAPGVGEKTEQKLWEKGTRHWDDFSETDVINGSRKDRITDFLEKAKRNLKVGNTPFFGQQLPSRSTWRLYENFRDNACFFDIETTGLDADRNSVTTVSFHRSGEDVTLVKGQDLTPERLREEIFESSILVSFNGKRFDQPFLEKNFDIDIEKPHIDLMYLCRRLGASGGLKQIEKDFGIDRELEDVDGREAIRLWKRYEQKGDKEALEKLVRYNRYDARNLKQLFREVHGLMTDKIFEPYRGP